MKKKFLLFVLAAAGLSLAMITGKTPVKKGVELSAMDLNADPRNDFWQYANGSWLKNNPIPPSEGRWGSFSELAEKNNQLLKSILEDFAYNRDKDPAGSIRFKIGTFYQMGMDSANLDKIGAAPLKPYFEKIDKIASTDEAMKLIAEFHKQGIGNSFGFYIGQDLKNSTAYIAYLGQGGLGLPDRDYYSKKDEKSSRIRAAYKEHVQKMLTLAGLENVERDMKYAYGIEEALADASMTRVELRDPEKTYNKYTYTQLRNAFPFLDWNIYFGTTGVKTTELIVSQPRFFQRLNTMFYVIPVEEWKAYMRWSVVNEFSEYLSQDMSKANFDFYGTVLTGTTQQKPRYKRMIGQVNSYMGELLAQAYVEKAFSPESKRRVNEMVDNLTAAFRTKIEKLEWMSPETKTKALEKLAAFNRKLGYPDKWEDYSALEIKGDSWFNDVVRANEFSYKKMTARLGKPIDKAKWNMLPQQVNAYYSAQMNEIVFPAAIMQPPFFDASADEAVNYGGIGAVIGHELLHGFDDKGSQFDKDGNLKNWWSEEDRKKFDVLTTKLADQYSRCKVMDSVYVNGKLTLGENIADLGGLTMAYEALQIYYKTHPKEKINGLTAEQRFYIGWAQVWRTNARPEFLRNQVMTDPHSPAEFRATVPLSNLETFYQAFGVKPGDKMYRTAEDRVVIW